MIQYIWLIFDASVCVTFCEFIRKDISLKKFNVWNIICLIIVLIDVTLHCYKIFKQNLN